MKVRLKHAPKDLNPDQLGWNQSCSHYTRDAWKSAEAVGLEPTSGLAADCFQDSVLIRPDDFRSSSCGSWNRTNGLLVQSQASLPTATTPHHSCSTTRVPSHGSHRAAGAGVEPADTWFKATYFYRQKLPRIRESVLRESNPPRQVGSLEPLPLGQGHKLFEAEGEGVEPSRP